MNEQTPRRLRGSLVERVVEHYGLGPDKKAEPQPAPPPVSTAFPEPFPSFDPFAGQPSPVPPGPVQEPVPAAPAAPVPTAAAEPVPAAAPAADPATVAPAAAAARPAVTIDRKKLEENGLLVPGAPITVLAEEFRLIKRQLLLTARAVKKEHSEKSRMILVCSAKPNEGKTYCAINLALSMAAEKDVEILLVDADFAKPDVLDRLGVTTGKGLLDLLAGDVDDAESCVVDTDIPQLSLLPAGTRTNFDTELLASDRAAALLDGLAQANPRRIVIFDSPPALAASPASVLAQHVGQVMLVVRADRTVESDLREAVALLDGCEHIQLALNAVSFLPGGQRFGSYYSEVSK